MAAYNMNFELSIDDLDLIETALRHTKKELANRVLETAEGHDEAVDGGNDLDGTLRQVQDLLGRLHNQKIFYRPREGAYIGG